MINKGMLFINIALLILGVTGTLAAFGGETWKKSTDPFLKRVTCRGWIALPCLISAFTLGVAKEVISNRRAIEARSSAEAIQTDLRRQLESAAQAQANLASKLDSANSALATSQQHLRETEKRLLSAVNTSTSHIPKEIDNPFFQTGSESKGGIIYSTKREPLIVYGGETIRYQIHGDGGDRPRLISFLIGDREYRLDSSTGSVQVVGIEGVAMPVRLLYPPTLTFAMKMALMSVGRPQ